MSKGLSSDRSGWRRGVPKGALALLAAMGAAALTSHAQSPKWEMRDGYRVAALTLPANGRTGFTLLSNAQLGVRFTNQLSFERASVNQNLLNGAGLATGDFDGDGICDLYLCNIEGRNALYRNLGHWKFQDVTEAAGVGNGGRLSTGATFADVNRDGRLDLLVTANGGPNVVFFNEGQGRFREAPLPPGMVTRAGSTSMALADIDGDGDLDLYIANYGENSILRSGGTISTRMVNGREEVVGRYRNRIKIVDATMYEFGEPDVLYLNDGQGGFAPVSWTDGRFLDEDGQPLGEAPWDHGLSVQFHDLNGDGAPDIYVCNDFQTPDRIWINNGRGVFRALERRAIRQTSNFSMTTDLADLDRDGFVDLFVADMLSRYHPLRMRQMDTVLRLPRLTGEIEDRPQIHRNVVLWNRGDGTYAEIANFAGLDASDWNWCAVWLDVDLDGFEDLLIGNGHAYDTLDSDADEQVKALGRVSGRQRQDTLRLFPLLPTPNMVFRNQGNLTFAETGQAWGYDSRQVTHSVALADFDNDGDLDLALNCLNDPPLFYRNETTAPRVAVRLKGLPPNTEGIGAKVIVRGGAVALQSQEIVSGGHYLSGSVPVRVFAAGTPTNDLSIDVTWRSGKRSVVANARPNCLYEMDEAAAQAPAPPPAVVPGPSPLFRDVSEKLGHVHEEVSYNDWDRQPLLHRSYSQLGPGVAWFDWDGDGREGLVIGTGRGGKLAVYRNDKKGGFIRLRDPGLDAPLGDDTLAIAGWIPSPGKRALLVAQANYESPENMPSLVWRYDFTEPAPQVVASIPGGSIGPLAVADFDGDGDLDVFVGGRIIAGRYPEPPSSYLYRNTSGKLELDAANSATLKNVGLVSAAVWSDWNGDGFPELALACEWGPVRLFQNNAGRLSEITASLGLDTLLGWWSSVAAGDFDGDGRLDLIAGNWGLNSSYYQPSAQNPARIFYGDFDGNSTLDLLEAYTDWETGRLVPRRNLLIMSSGLPTMRTRYPTHLAWSKLDVNTILEGQQAKTPQLQANTLASVVFLNRGNKFELVPLPPQAQWAPVQGLSVADLDGDGQEDAVLGQNYFAMRAEEPRLDAGRGLWLKGGGDGRFTAVPGQESGIKVYGEQRATALADYDQDGRVDLVITQNGAATKLFHNEQGRPGVRVRLLGLPGNPDGIGAVMRLKFGKNYGPSRELHAGSGYWSQDSAVPVLATPTAPTHLEVRWPGGKATTSVLPANAREVSVDTAGALKVIR